MRWNVYNARGNYIGKINGQTRKAALARAKEKFGFYVEAVLTDAEKTRLEKLVISDDDN